MSGYSRFSERRRLHSVTKNVIAVNISVPHIVILQRFPMDRNNTSVLQELNTVFLDSYCRQLDLVIRGPLAL